MIKNSLVARIVNIAFGAVFSLLFLGVFGIGDASASTNVSGNITSNTTWTTSGSPYIIVDPTAVSYGATLIVEAGVVVKFDTGSNDYLQVDGTLDVNGTAGSRVTFTSLADTGAGQWNGIRFTSGSYGYFDNAVLRYGGRSCTYCYPNQKMVWNQGGTLVFTDSEIRNAQYYAIYQDTAGSSITITGDDSVVENSGSDVYVTYGTLTVADGAEIKDKLDVRSTATSLTIEDSYVTNATVESWVPFTFNDNVLSGATVRLKALAGFTHSGNSVVSGIGGYYVSGSVASNSTLNAHDLPFIIESLTVGSGKTLTVQPGTVIKLKDTSAAFDVYGTLEVFGDETAPVYFTSYKDDEAGGDTNDNGSANTPTAGDWSKLDFKSGSDVDMTYVVVRYGGYNATAAYRYMIYNNGDLYLEDSFISDSYSQGLNQASGTTTFLRTALYDNVYGAYVSSGTFSFSLGVIAVNSVGIQATGGTVLVSDSYIAANTSYGVYATISVDAEDNYWGDDSGPYPVGSGDAITGSVDSAPFRDEPWLVMGASSVDAENQVVEWDGSTVYDAEWTDALSIWNELHPIDIYEADPEVEGDLTLHDIDAGVMGYCGLYAPGPGTILFSVGDMEETGCADYKSIVATHELGHALGLHHSLNGTVMAAFVNNGSETLATQDLFIYHALWGF